MKLTLGEPVPSLRGALGEFFVGREALGGMSGQDIGSYPVFHQRLRASAYYVAFDPGSHAHQVLANDQNRFNLPRSLPPILDLVLPQEPDNPTDDYVITRHAYSDGAFTLLEELLDEGFVLSMNQYLEFAWNLAQALAFLHTQGIVHGQWNARSIAAIPRDDAGAIGHASAYRFEVLNTGVCFRNGDAIPKEYLERGYYPREVFLGTEGVPDYHAIDLKSDTYCFAAFLKDILQRSCSTEELPSQARRTLDDLQKEALHKGWKAAPEKLRQKELEILDHLYTIKLGIEELIQEGLRTRELRPAASDLLERAQQLHERATEYTRLLRKRGFEPVNVFGDELQHYTAFSLKVEPARINNHQDSEVVLSGGGLPHELVRVTLNERHRGVHLAGAKPGRVVFRVDRGFPMGTYKVGINNRRTNGTLEVFAPTWRQLEPESVHQPWMAFDNPLLLLRGSQLPDGAHYSLRVVDDGDTDGDDGNPRARPEPIEIRNVRPVTGATEESGDRDATPSETPPPLAAMNNGDEVILELEVPAETRPGHYELFANDISTGLRVRVLDALPAPYIEPGALDQEEIKNYRAWTLRVCGRFFHPEMVLDLGEDVPDGCHVTVEGQSEAVLSIPAGFAAGEYELRMNYQPTGVMLKVVEPSWSHVEPASFKISRTSSDGHEVRVHGDALPPPGSLQQSYSLQGRWGPVEGGIESVEEAEAEEVHRLRIAPQVGRGRHRLFFGEADTGLALRVRRQYPLVVHAGVLCALLALLAFTGMALKSHYEPLVASVEPSSIYNFRASDLTVEGAYMDSVELVSAEHGTVRVPVVAEDDAGHYQARVEGLRNGTYQVRPVGPLFAGTVTDVTLEVRSPGLEVQPARIHRHTETLVRVTADADFPIEELGTITLARVVTETSDADAAPAALELALENGSVLLPPGVWPASAEGTYALAIDGTPLERSTALGGSEPWTLEITGAQLTAVTEPVIPDAGGQVLLPVEGSAIPDSLWLGLIPDGQGDVAHRLEPRGPDHFGGDAALGRYTLAWGHGDQVLEEIPELTLRVFPPPSITALTPEHIDPEHPATVTFTGVNLPALSHITLRPTVAEPGEWVELALEPGFLRMTSELDGTYRAENVVLASGTYQVEPSETPLILEVFDDCRQLLMAYGEEGGDPTELMQCLEEQRPPADVIALAADVLYDQGHFAESRRLYTRLDSLDARFRATFLGFFVEGGTAPMAALAPGEESELYGAAAILLGLAPGTAERLPVSDVLPWDLEFVQGYTATEPELAVSAFERSIAKKREAAVGAEAQPFAPAINGLARSLLDLALERIRKSDAIAARQILSERLAGDADLWKRLEDADRARIDFWIGHLALWYEGDEEVARASLERAAGGKGEAAGWAQQYLAALGSAPTRAAAAAAATDASAERGTRTVAATRSAGAWPAAMLPVFGYYKEIAEHPNFNLLTESYDFDVYLPEEDRQKSMAFHRALRTLESFKEPTDPFVHNVLLYYLRNAQRVSWPTQEGGAKAGEHLSKLSALPAPETLTPLRDFYISLGDIGPLDARQIQVLPSSFRDAQTERLQSLKTRTLPTHFLKAATELENKLSGTVTRSHQ